MSEEVKAWMLLGVEDRKPVLINLQVIEHLEGEWIPLYAKTEPTEIPRTYDEYMKSNLVSKEWEAGFIAGKMHELERAVKARFEGGL